jgi:hypothetical protein
VRTAEPTVAFVDRDVPRWQPPQRQIDEGGNEQRQNAGDARLERHERWHHPHKGGKGHCPHENESPNEPTDEPQRECDDRSHATRQPDGYSPMHFQISKAPTPQLIDRESTALAALT